MAEDRERFVAKRGAGRFSFGEFVLDATSVQLRRGEDEIPLPPRAFDLLEYFVRHPGRVLAKEELLDAVWEGRFVGEESLTQAVSLLRQVLNDDPHEPAYIRTVPKRGYAFVADVESEGGAPETRRRVPGLAIRTRHARRWVVVAGLLAVGGLGLVWLAGRGESGGETRRVMRLSVNLASADGGDIGIAQGSLPGVPFAISPDGTRLVVLGNDGRGNRLFLRKIDGFGMTAMPNTEGVGTRPLFSPDGQWVAFMRGTTLEKVSVRGGSSIEIAEMPGKWYQDWGADNTILMTGGGSGELWEILATGGHPTQITGIDRSDGSLLYAQDLLPDGESLLVFSHTIEPWRFHLEILSRSTGERRRILDTGGFHARYLPNGYIVYADGNTLFAVPVDERTLEPLEQPVPVLEGVYPHEGYSPWYSVSDNGTLVYLREDSMPSRGLVWVSRDGSVSSVPGGQLQFSTVRISPDGRSAALTLIDGLDREIWVLDLQDGTLTPVMTKGWNSLPNWSPDGTELAYYALRGDGNGLSVRRSDGVGPEQRLFTRNQRVFPRHWSPDGRRIVFLEGSRTWQFIDGEVKLLEIEPPGVRSFRFSPDGQWIAFEAKEGDNYHVYVQSFPEPGPRIQASASIDAQGEPGEGRSPNWRADGKELYYSSRGAVFAVAVETAPELRIGSPRLLFEGDYYLDFDATPDGERFLMRAPGILSSPRELQVVLNWFDEIERLAPHPHH